MNRAKLYHAIPADAGDRPNNAVMKTRFTALNSGVVKNSLVCWNAVVRVHPPLSGGGEGRPVRDDP